MPVDKETRKEALDIALKSAKVFGFELDYSNRSIQIVDKILDLLSKDYKSHSRDKEDVSKTAFCFAAYIVEVVERNFPDKRGEWEVDEKEMGEETYPYVFPDRSKIFPWAWCMKRIFDGKGHDVWFKYEVFILDKLKDAKPYESKNGKNI